MKEAIEVYFKSDVKVSIDLRLIEDLLRQVDWGEPIDEIQVRRTFSEGFSGCDVLEVELAHAGQSHLAVAKIGAADELRKERNAFKKVDRRAIIRNRNFTRVRAGSSSVMSKSEPRLGAPGVLVYDHAGDVLIGHSRSFEELVRLALSEGGETLQMVIAVLDDLMGGLKQLYGSPATITKGTNWFYWNEWLGADAIVEVDAWNSASGAFVHSDFAASRQIGVIDTSKGLREAVVDLDGKGLRGSAFEMDLEREWWGNKLFGRPPKTKLLVEIDCKDAGSLSGFRTQGKRGGFRVSGVIRSLRTEEQRSRIRSRLDGVVSIENGVVNEANAPLGATIVADPFLPLPQILDRKATGLTSLVHGDLHGGNILVVQTRNKNNLPCVIDYRWMGDDRPFLFDFVKLETTLTRNAFPNKEKQEEGWDKKEFTWPQTIHLQRMLALATRLGGSADDEIRKMLASLDQRLANAFSLIAAIRHHARTIHPHGNQADWYMVYAESLFLSAHSTFKWESKTRWEDIASLAIAAVAAEWLQPDVRYQWWSKSDLANAVKRLAKSIISTADISEISSIYRVVDAQRWHLPAVEAVLVRAAKAHLATSYNDVTNELVSIWAEERNFYMSIPAAIKIKGRVNGGTKRDVLEILRSNQALVVLGDMGSGKTTVAQVWQYELANDLRRKANGPGRLPLIIPARFAREIPLEISREVCLAILQKASHLQTEETKQRALREKLDSKSINWEELLIAGAVHITIDALNEVEESRKGDIVRWILSLRKYFPRCPTVVCHRLYNYSPGLLPFPVAELQRVEYEDVIDYIRQRSKNRDRGTGESLIQLLFPKNPLPEAERQKIDDLIQTPFLLMMIVETCFDETLGLESFLTGRGALFSRFADKWLSGTYRQTKKEQSIANRHPVAKKLAFLSSIGSFLVKQRTRRSHREGERGDEGFIPRWEIEALAVNEGVREWAIILEEIVDVGMLLRSTDGYSFRYQSFEEYFAAVQFFSSEPTDDAALAALVKSYAWHDTLVILVDYADLNEKRLDDLVYWTRIVDPVLTARILRVAERKDRPRQRLFLISQMEVLRSSDAGRHLWAKAAEAIAILDSEESVDRLMEIARDSQAPPGARAEALRRVSLLRGRV